MNEAMPPRRTFSSNAPPGPPMAGPSGPAAASPTTRPGWAWQVPLLAALGGAAAGAAVVLLVVVLLGAGSDVGATSGLGEPLDAPFTLAMGVGDRLAEEPGFDAQEIVIDVAGAVARPGLHRLRAGDRVGDAIEAAGGFAPRADLAAASQSLNLARPLEDGAKVLVPELGIDDPESLEVTDGLVDLNRADQAELESLPGIGPVTARKILDARSERRFGAARDLRSRGLVGESVFADIKGLVRAD